MGRLAKYRGKLEWGEIPKPGKAAKARSLLPDGFAADDVAAVIVRHGGMSYAVTLDSMVPEGAELARDGSGQVCGIPAVAGGAPGGEGPRESQVPGQGPAGGAKRRRGRPRKSGGPAGKGAGCSPKPDSGGKSPGAAGLGVKEGGGSLPHGAFAPFHSPMEPMGMYVVEFDEGCDPFRVYGGDQERARLACLGEIMKMDHGAGGFRAVMYGPMGGDFETGVDDPGSVEGPRGGRRADDGLYVEPEPGWKGKGLPSLEIRVDVVAPTPDCVRVHHSWGDCAWPLGGAHGRKARCPDCGRVARLSPGNGGVPVLDYAEGEPAILDCVESIRFLVEDAVKKAAVSGVAHCVVMASRDGDLGVRARPNRHFTFSGAEVLYVAGPDAWKPIMPGEWFTVRRDGADMVVLLADGGKLASAGGDPGEEISMIRGIGGRTPRMLTLDGALRAIDWDSAIGGDVDLVIALYERRLDLARARWGGRCQ